MVFDHVTNTLRAVLYSEDAPKKKKTKFKLTDKAQSERFMETARELGVDESGEEFERALKTIVKSVPSSE